MSILHGFHRLEANLSYGFHNSLVNTFLQVFNNAPLDVNLLTVVEISQDLTQDAFYPSVHLKVVQFFSAASQLQRLFEGGAYFFSNPCAARFRVRRLFD